MPETRPMPRTWIVTEMKFNDVDPDEVDFTIRAPGGMEISMLGEGSA